MKNNTAACTPPVTHDLEACLPLVKAITARVRATRAPVASFEDLYAIGLDGLLDAAERFDPTRGVAFTTFAFYRIRGAILDGLRREALGRRVECPTAGAGVVHMAAPALQVANDNGQREVWVAPPSEPLRWAESVMPQVVAFADIDSLPDERLRPVDEELDQRDLVARIQGALARLSEEDRAIIEMHYYEDLTFAQIGERLGVCKPWAFRRLQRAMGRLREAVTA